MTSREQRIYRQLSALFAELAEIPIEIEKTQPTEEPKAEKNREEKEWLTKKEFCSKYRISTTTAWLWAKKGRVETLTLSPRVVRYSGEVRG